ncbi:uncharacterized protein LOC128549526 [Mercenaria mercenaria]|uniref:uncharacterized protein LOC128549526 n=1 Tax=Mercenaria mercenaria TaxID=6596 RepID=UPI00234FB012|nr:uncharacterized protein LOC128549526 [Mercenaria mercenaria]
MALTHTALDKRFWRSGGTTDIMSETEPLDESFVDCSLLDGSLLDESTEETVTTVTDVTEQHLTVNHHQCQICEKVYKGKDSLTRHMKIHQEHVFFVLNVPRSFTMKQPWLHIKVKSMRAIIYVSSAGNAIRPNRLWNATQQHMTIRQRLINALFVTKHFPTK